MNHGWDSWLNGSIWIAPPAFTNQDAPRSPCPAAYSRAPSGVSVCCTTDALNTHKTETREVRYPWHPWYGRQVAVRGVRNRHGVKVLFCTVDDVHEFPVLEVSEWMFDPVVCGRLERAEGARADVGALRALQALLESVGPGPSQRKIVRWNFSMAVLCGAVGRQNANSCYSRQAGFLTGVPIECGDHRLGCHIGIR